MNLFSVASYMILLYSCFLSNATNGMFYAMHFFYFLSSLLLFSLIFVCSHDFTLFTDDSVDMATHYHCQHTNVFHYHRLINITGIHIMIMIIIVIIIRHCARNVIFNFDMVHRTPSDRSMECMCVYVVQLSSTLCAVRRKIF